MEGELKIFRTQFLTGKAQNMFIASVRPSVRLKPEFGRLKTKFDDDAGSTKQT